MFLDLGSPRPWSVQDGTRIWRPTGAGQGLSDSWLGNSDSSPRGLSSSCGQHWIIHTVNPGFPGQRDKAMSDVKCRSAFCLEHMCHHPVEHSQASDHQRRGYLNYTSRGEDLASCCQSMDDNRGGICGCVCSLPQHLGTAT